MVWNREGGQRCTSQAIQPSYLRIGALSDNAPAEATIPQTRHSSGCNVGMEVLATLCLLLQEAWGITIHLVTEGSPAGLYSSSLLWLASATPQSDHSPSPCWTGYLPVTVLIALDRIEMHVGRSPAISYPLLSCPVLSCCWSYKPSRTSPCSAISSCCFAATTVLYMAYTRVLLLLFFTSVKPGKRSARVGSSTCGVCPLSIEKASSAVLSMLAIWKRLANKKLKRPPTVPCARLGSFICSLGLKAAFVHRELPFLGTVQGYDVRTTKRIRAHYAS